MTRNHTRIAPASIAAVSVILLLWASIGCTNSGKKGSVAGQTVVPTAIGLLSQEDVNLYLELMRAAAARVNNLLPADKTALGRMSKVQDDVKAGRIPTPSEGDPEAEVIERGMKVRQAMDLIIAEDKGVDVARYATIRDLIENLVNPSGFVEDADNEVFGKPLTPTQAEIRLANKKILAPHAPEIEQLYQVVRRSLVENPPK